jgi:hypothetical protein
LELGVLQELTQTIGNAVAEMLGGKASKLAQVDHPATAIGIKAA